MADPVTGVQGGYTNGTQVVSAAANTEIQANIAKLKALIPDPEAGLSAPHTDHDQISPQLATRLRAEIDAMSAAIAAAPDA